MTALAALGSGWVYDRYGINGLIKAAEIDAGLGQRGTPGRCSYGLAEAFPDEQPRHGHVAGDRQQRHAPW
jgi:hypothetical protein